jgi:DNA-binding winged helix-turn-helix (wHTH) protein
MESHDPGQTPHVYEFGDFRLDTENTTSHRLLLNGQPYKIQNKQFCLLSILVKNQGREFSSEELIRQVWSDHVVDDSNRAEYVDNLHHLILFLRGKIGKEKIPYKKKVGYYLAAPVKVIQVPTTPSEVYRDFEFNQWVFYSRECWLIKIFLGVGVALSLLFSIAYLLRDPMLDWPDPAMALCLIQFVVVGGALIASFSVFDSGVKEFPRSPVADAALMKISGYDDPQKWADAKTGAKSSLERYSRYWKFLLVAWAGLYLLLILTMHSKGVYEPSTHPYHPFWALSIASTVFNNFNSLAIALCFVVLNHPTVLRGEGQNTSLNRLTGRIIKWGLPTIIAFALVESFLVFFLPLTQWFDSMTRANVVWAADFFSGIVGAITLALYVGRIQSKFLGPSTWLPLAFYLYVAIQSMFVAILEGAKWGAAIIEAALILKCLLYLYVAWLFKSGRLLFYLVRVKTIYERVNIEWQEFLANLNRDQ